jgi:putative transposase
MDGKGRWMDNVFIERLWRSLKYEQIRLYSYANLKELREQITEWMDFYNHERDHQHLGYTTPWANYEQTLSPVAGKAA